MNFEPNREQAIINLDTFIENNLSEYSELRNFDFGPTKRSNISCLSPYISHGIINEIEVIKKSLKKFSFVENEKFIQEILWRTYWKGWLELRPNVWTDFLLELKTVRKEYEGNQNYLKAVNGKTEIDCFNFWVRELKEFNYLHNHTRMWFASIWIFTLKLPWQLGAEFFIQNLYDGDAASNTLGWRWVAGIQTKGKNYLANEWNIKKFSNNRFKNIKLDEKAPPIIKKESYSIIKKDFINPTKVDNKNLLIFENNLSFEVGDFKNIKFKKIFLISNKNLNREIKLSEKINNFKKLLLEDQLKRLKKNRIDCEIKDISELKNIEYAYALYPSIGENLDYLERNNFDDLTFLFRELDQFSWQFCNKGFFNFKNYIPKIIQRFI